MKLKDVLWEKAVAFAALGYLVWWLSQDFGGFAHQLMSVGITGACAACAVRNAWLGFIAEQIDIEVDL